MIDFKKAEKSLSLILLLSFLISIFAATVIHQVAIAGPDQSIGQDPGGNPVDQPVDKKCKWYQAGCWFKVLKACWNCAIHGNLNDCIKCAKRDPKAA